MKALVLIGPRGAGKTTVGQLLANRMRVPFVDTDDAIAERVGMSASAYLRQHGETAFRQIEEEAVAALSVTAEAVVAFGGGAVVSVKNQELIQRVGRVVWLDAPVHVLIDRVKQTPRPALTDLSLDAEVATLYSARRPIYEALAMSHVMTDRPIEEVVGELERIWRTF